MDSLGLLDFDDNVNTGFGFFIFVWSNWLTYMRANPVKNCISFPAAFRFTARTNTKHSQQSHDYCVLYGPSEISSDKKKFGIQNGHVARTIKSM